MAYVRISNLLEVHRWEDNLNGTVGGWVPDLFFHNADPDVTVSYLDSSWRYLPFIYQGAVRNRSGDNIQGTIILPSNRLSMDYAQSIVKRKLKVAVYTCIMNAGFDTVDAVLSKENWAGTSMSYDAEGLELTLASRVDAISFTVPNQYLRKEIVGELPTTGNITSR
jgi:hypothetical protein